MTSPNPYASPLASCGLQRRGRRQHLSWRQATLLAIALGVPTGLALALLGFACWAARLPEIGPGSLSRGIRSWSHMFELTVVAWIGAFGVTGPLALFFWGRDSRWDRHARERLGQSAHGPRAGRHGRA